MLIRFLTLCFSGLLAFAPAAASPLQGLPAPGARGAETRICLELMDLDSPEQGQEEMELPPLKAGEEEKPARGEAPASKVLSVPETRRSGEPVPKADVALPPLKMPAGVWEEPVRKAAPAVGLSPMILPPPPPIITEQELMPLKALEPRGVATKEPASLKAVAPPAARDQGLKLPSSGAGSPVESSPPEMPILVGTGDREEPQALMAPPLPVKPVQKTAASQDSQGAPGVLAEADAAKKTAAPGEDLDSKLVEIYERFYRNR